MNSGFDFYGRFLIAILIIRPCQNRASSSSHFCGFPKMSLTACWLKGWTLPKGLEVYLSWVPFSKNLRNVSHILSLVMSFSSMLVCIRSPFLVTQAYSSPFLPNWENSIGLSWDTLTLVKWYYSWYAIHPSFYFQSTDTSGDIVNYQKAADRYSFQPDS